MDNDKITKEYNLFVMRKHFQVWATEKMFGNLLYMQKPKQNYQLYKQNVDCMKPEEPEIKKVEKYKISLNTQNPNLKDLYSKIQEVCPEFINKRKFHLYWKYSATEVLPVSNYITYLSMMSLIANQNNNLYLIAREWDLAWSSDPAATYMPLAEDRLLVNMVAPNQSIFTATQEEQVKAVKDAAMTEFTSTYNPPEREHPRKSSSKSKPISPKSKSAKKK